MEPPCGHLLQAVVQDAAQGGREGAVPRLGFLLEDGGEGVRGRGPHEGPAAREHLEEHRPEAEDVGAGVHLLAPHLFGAHVARGAQHRALVGDGGPLVGAGLAGQAEVQDLQAAVLGDPEVAGRQVPVDDPLLVGGGEPLRHLDGQVGGLAGGKRSPGQTRLEGLAFQEFHHHEAHLAFGLEVVDAQDVGMVQGRDGLGLPVEPRQGPGVPVQVARQDLDGHEAVQARVPGLVHLPHAPRAQGTDDFVRAQAGAAGQFHGSIISEDPPHGTVR